MVQYYRRLYPLFVLEKLKEKEKALVLRKSGLSYQEILSQVTVAKSTLSLWLRSVGLSRKQKQRLTAKKQQAMARGWEKVRNNRIKKSEKIKNLAREEVSRLIQDPLWLVGTMLYWAEGKKERTWRTGETVAFSNMDCNMHKIFLRWVRKYIQSDKKALIFDLYIHEGADIEHAKIHWSEELQIPSKEIRVYLKKDNSLFYRKNINKEYTGLLCVKIRRSIDLNRKIAGWIQGVIKYL